MQYDFQPAKHRVRDMVIKVHTACNLNCKMCRFQDYVRTSKSDIPQKYIKRALYQFKKYNRDGCVEFGTGEVFAHKKAVYPYLEYCKKIGLKVVIATNGTLVTEADVEFIKGSTAAFIVSLDSHREAVHDFVRGAGTLAKALPVLELLNNHGVPYTVNTVVSKLNIDHLTEMYDFFLSGKYFEQHCLNLISKSFFRKSEDDPFYDHYSFRTNDEKDYAKHKLAEYAVYTRGYRTSYSNEVHASTINLLDADNVDAFSLPMCNIFERSLIMLENGDLCLCYQDCFPPVGNITDKDFDLKNIWEGKHTQEQRKKMAQCLYSCGIFLCNNKKLSFNKLKNTY